MIFSLSLEGYRSPFQAFTEVVGRMDRCYGHSFHEINVLLVPLGRGGNSSEPYVKSLISQSSIPLSDLQDCVGGKLNINGICPMLQFNSYSQFIPGFSLV